jgi:hypothetical protein
MKKNIMLKAKGIFKLPKSIWALGITFLLLIGIAPTVFAGNTNTDLGKWQTNVQGGAGKGDTYLELNFNNDGTVKIKKQATGINDQEDNATWKITGDELSINGKIIKDFNGKKIIKADKGTYKWVPEGEATQVNVTKIEKGLSIVHFLMLLIVLILVNELCRRVKYAGYILFLAGPIILLPVWLNSDITMWFRWVKLYSAALLGGGFFTLVRFTKIGEKKWAKWAVAAVLCLNILEACIQDFSCGYLPNTLNAIAGILNIIVLSRWLFIGPDNSKEKDMLWPGMTTFWIIVYDIWNITFVYLNVPGHTSHHIMVLLACTLPAIFIKKGTWLQARGYTLGAWMMYFFTFSNFVDRMDIMLPRNKTIMMTMAILSISGNIIYAILHFTWKYTGKAPKNIEVGQNEVAC